MAERTFYGILLLLAIFIYVAEGVLFNPFALWNMLPLGLAYLIYRSSRVGGSKARLYAAYGFLIGSMILSGFLHIAWLFDLGNAKTGSSTSSLIFIFIPVYSLIPGAIGFVVGKGMAVCRKV